MRCAILRLFLSQLLQGALPVWDLFLALRPAFGGGGGPLRARLAADGARLDRNAFVIRYFGGASADRPFVVFQREGRAEVCAFVFGGAPSVHWQQVHLVEPLTQLVV